MIAATWWFDSDIVWCEPFAAPSTAMTLRSFLNVTQFPGGNELNFWRLSYLEIAAVWKVWLLCLSMCLLSSNARGQDHSALTNPQNSKLDSAINELLEEIYAKKQRSQGHLDFPERDWVLSGAGPGAPGDQYGGRDDLFARWGRAYILSEFERAASKLSASRIDSYQDQREALTELLTRVGKDSERGRFVEQLLERLAVIEKKERGAWSDARELRCWRSV
jgi:hypothetical protein